MTKALRKTIMKRSELKSKHFKNQTALDFELYKKQKSYCSKLYKKERDITIISISQIFNDYRYWKTVKPFSSDRGSYTKTNLANKDEVISDDSTQAETFSKFFESAMKNLGISEEIL